MNSLAVREDTLFCLVLFNLQGDDMTSTGPDSANSNRQPIKSGSSAVELNERLGNTVNELYELLELYAPAWYTEELHERAEAALLAVGRGITPMAGPQRKSRACRNLGSWSRPASP